MCERGLQCYENSLVDVTLGVSRNFDKDVRFNREKILRSVTDKFLQS